MGLRLRHLLALVVVSSCRCAELTPGLIYPCSSNGECEPGLVCRMGLCVADDGGSGGSGEDGGVDAGCVPSVTCEPDQCGVVTGSDNGCGEPLDCGACSEPFSCGLLAKNRCGCIPFDAGSQVCPRGDAGIQMCGDITVNNCGVFETFICGPATCAATGFECTDNLCCLPPTESQLCATSKTQCGRGVVIDFCGTRREINCGSCAGGMRCVPSDEGTTCVSPVCTPESDAELCSRHGANCGTLSAVDACGNARTNVVCGGACDAGDCTSTLPNQCVCQSVLQGCMSPQQCCGGLTCGPASLCCVALADACTDDSDCCSTGICTQGSCCGNVGVACTRDAQCCSGACGMDGGCEYVDAGTSVWDGGEL